MVELEIKQNVKVNAKIRYSRAPSDSEEVIKVDTEVKYLPRICIKAVLERAENGEPLQAVYGDWIYLPPTSTPQEVEVEIAEVEKALETIAKTVSEWKEEARRRGWEFNLKFETPDP